MISHLYVKNYALIEEMQIDFAAGFSSITGETGAGKSILLGAMGLALGERADVKSALDAAEKCVIELTVKLTGYNLENWFEQNELDYAEETILRREILPSGKSRAFVNDTPSKVSALNQLAARLIDIHSQNDTILLRDTAFQLSLIDGLAGNQEELKRYADAYQQAREAKKVLDQITLESTDGKDMDYQRFLLDELIDAKLTTETEEEVIEEELRLLQHSEEVTEAITGAIQSFDEPSGLTDRMEQVLQFLNSAMRYDSKLQDLYDRLKSVQIELNDVQSELESVGSSLDNDPQRLQILDDRMSLLQHLKSKHRVGSLAELIEVREEIDESIQNFERLAERIQEAEQVLNKKMAERDKFAVALTKSRLKVLPSIQQEIQDILSKLNMPDARVVMNLQQAPEATASGVDQMEWLFSANAGRSTQPLNKIASGGELSRVMLALKAIMSKSKGLPTIIFDEIDTGISGETARRVADILREMGTKMQVLAITHLPQIAAAGKNHYLVEKQKDGDITRSNIRLLSPEERVEEVSRILSGDKASEAARANAEELLAEE